VTTGAKRRGLSEPVRRARLAIRRPSGPARKRRGRLGRALRDLSLVLVISGALLLADAAATLLWQEPLSALIAVIKQGSLDERFLSYQHAPLSRLDLQALAKMKQARQRVAFLARQEARQIKTGQAIGTIGFPKFNSQYIVVQGTDEGSLEKGPGHYPQTAFPGVQRTVAIAGHRTTYLAPFRRLNELKSQNKIVLTMRYARFTYAVQRVRIVTPTSWWIIKDKGYEQLVLSACNPLYSAAQRIVVFARLRNFVPLGPAQVAAVHTLWWELQHVFVAR
jgi:sortase A